MYQNGQGLPQDNEAAYRWYQEAANQGHMQAQNNLGTLYEDGQGVKQDYAMAVMWYQKSAEQGLKEAQFNLAEMYANGRGVNADIDKAREWYRKAAEQGHAKSIAALKQHPFLEPETTIETPKTFNQPMRVETPRPFIDTPHLKDPRKDKEYDFRTNTERAVDKCVKQVQYL